MKVLLTVAVAATALLNAGPPAVVVHRDGVTASIAPAGRFRALTTASVRIRIVRRGRTLVNESIIRVCRLCVEWTSRPLFARDLDGDRQPEVIAQFDVGGAHCCLVSIVYSYDARRHAYHRVVHEWPGEGADYRLRDLDRDGRPEFVSAADFECAFIACAETVDPRQIWSFRQGFVDVTKRFPTVVRPQAVRYGRECRNRHVHRLGREPVCAAWVADGISLGRSAPAWRYVAAEFRGLGVYWNGSGPRYLTVLRDLLRETGFLR